MQFLPMQIWSGTWWRDDSTWILQFSEAGREFINQGGHIVFYFGWALLVFFYRKEKTYLKKKKKKKQYFMYKGTNKPRELVLIALNNFSYICLG